MSEIITLVVDDSNVKTLLLGMLARIELLEKRLTKVTNESEIGLNDLEKRMSDLEDNFIPELTKRVDELETKTDDYDQDRIDELSKALDDLPNENDMEAKLNEFEERCEKLDKDMDRVNQIFAGMSEAINS